MLSDEQRTSLWGICFRLVDEEKYEEAIVGGEFLYRDCLETLVRLLEIKTGMKRHPSMSKIIDGTIKLYQGLLEGIRVNNELLKLYLESQTPQKNSGEMN